MKKFLCRQSTQHPETKSWARTLGMQLPQKQKHPLMSLTFLESISDTYRFLNDCSERRYRKCLARFCFVFKPPPVQGADSARC